MIIRDVNLETVCGITSRLPENVLPEFAFAGKSNVGKSSLINGLMNRKSYAKTSSQPGKTQTINFYNINQALYFVDLPGYGYAKVPQSVKEKWGKMIERYLRKSKMLKRVFLLVDIRHEPSANDRMMYDLDRVQWLPAGDYRHQAGQAEAQPGAGPGEVHPGGLGMGKDGRIIPFSAETKQGREEIWELIEAESGLKAPAVPAEKENI